MSDEKNITTTEYTEMTRDTAVYPRGLALEYLVLGLCSESGEIASLLKKAIRDSDYSGVLSDDTKSLLCAELGDVLWYVTRLCDEINVSLDDIMRINHDKLKSRKARGVIGGSGDHR